MTYNQAYYQANKERIKAQSRAWRIANTERVKAHRKAYKEANGEKIKVSRKEYYALDPKKYIEAASLWQVLHPENRARARRKYKYGLTHEQFENLLVGADNKCEICQTGVDEKTVNVDHSHKTGRVRGALCRKCNLRLGVLQKEDGRWVGAATAYLENRGY